MKKLLFLFALIVCSLASWAQSKGYIVNDSTYFEKRGGNSEVILENGTKDTVGFLYNKGGGRTIFKRALIRLNDTTYIIGHDTLHTNRGIDSKNIGNSNLTLTGNRHLSGSNTHGLNLDSLIEFTVLNPIRQGLEVGGTVSPGVVVLGDIDLANQKTQIVVDDPSISISMIAQNGLSLTLNSFSGSNRVVLKTQIGFGGNNNIYLPGYDTGIDTLATKKNLRDGIAAVGGGNPFADNASLVKNNADNTKQVTIGALNVATGNNRTLQSPDANGTIVLNDNTATLTNKTIAAGSNSISGLTNSNLSGSAAISNANLSNSAITINGVSTSLGGSTNVTDATLSTSDITTNNVGITKHGFAPKAPNDATKYLDGTGAWSTPPGGVSPDVVTPITSGTSSTVPNGTNIILMNPGSITSAYSLTFPATPHSSNTLTVLFGGTVTSGTVITTLTSVANSGQTLNTVSATGTGTFGEPWVWKQYNNVWYRIQ